MNMGANSGVHDGTAGYRRAHQDVHCLLKKNAIRGYSTDSVNSFKTWHILWHIVMNAVSTDSVEWSLYKCM